MSDLIDYDKLFDLDKKEEPAKADEASEVEEVSVQPELDENQLRRQRMIEMHKRYEAKKGKKSFYERAGIKDQDYHYVMTKHGTAYSKMSNDYSYYRRRDEEKLEFYKNWWPTIIVMIGSIGVCRLLSLPISGYIYGLMMGFGLGVVIKYNLNNNMTFSQALKHCIPLLIVLFVIMMLYTLVIITGVWQNIVEQLII